VHNKAEDTGSDSRYTPSVRHSTGEGNASKKVRHSVRKEGFILIDKPKGRSSFHVVYEIRKRFGIKKVGHAGTLDPIATGLLIIAVGRGATKKIDLISKDRKEYIVDFELGKVSNTYDSTGDVEDSADKILVTYDDIVENLKSFEGEIDQMPPKFSAKWVNGKRAYDLARRGVEFELKTKRVTIYDIELIGFKKPRGQIRVECSAGTYMRSIVHDLGQILKCGAVMTDLVRTSIGKFRLEDAVTLDKIDGSEKLIPPHYIN